MAKNSGLGKYLEEEFETQLKKVDNPKLYWHRLPDSHAARGRLPAQPADYLLCVNGDAAYWELKSSGSKTNRLKKFSQMPPMLKASKAGMGAYVLVHFYEPDTFYVVDVCALDPSKPSWVMDDDNSRQVESVEALVKTMEEFIDDYES